MIRCFPKIIHSCRLLCFSVCVMIKSNNFPQHKPQYYLKPRNCKICAILQYLFRLFLHSIDSIKKHFKTFFSKTVGYKYFTPFIGKRGVYTHFSPFYVSISCMSDFSYAVPRNYSFHCYSFLKQTTRLHFLWESPVSFASQAGSPLNCYFQNLQNQLKVS